MATRHGRTSFYPVDPYFKKLNPNSMKKSCPKLNLETVFEESKFMLEKKWMGVPFEDENNDTVSYEKCDNVDNAHPNELNESPQSSEYESFSEE